MDIACTPLEASIGNEGLQLAGYIGLVAYKILEKYPRAESSDEGIIKTYSPAVDYFAAFILHNINNLYVSLHIENAFFLIH